MKTLLWLTTETYQGILRAEEYQALDLLAKKIDDLKLPLYPTASPPHTPAPLYMELLKFALLT